MLVLQRLTAALGHFIVTSSAFVTGFYGASFKAPSGEELR
jgi:hypothetical protein